MIKKLLYLAFAFAMSLHGLAQTARWVIKPTNKEVISFSEQLFKVKSYSLSGIVDNEGKTVLSIASDSITNITNGYALVLKAVDGKYRIIDIVSQYGSIIHVKDELYAVNYSFFSEDMCVVQNKKGKFGFLNNRGVLQIPCSYVSAHPFKEGLASVGKSKGGLKGLINNALSTVGIDNDNLGPSVYIDTKNVPLKLQKELGTPVIATSFHNGKAFIQNEEGRCYTIDKNGGLISIESSMSMKFDPYFSVLNEGENTPTVNQPYVKQKDGLYQVFREGNLYGYHSGSRVMLPTQFKKAGEFMEGYAIAETDRGVGVLKFIAGNVDCDVRESDGKLFASATVPSEVSANQVYLVRKLSTGDAKYSMEGKSMLSLNFNIPSTSEDVVYELESDNLVLWRSTDTVNKKEDNEEKQQPVQRSGGISVSAPAVVKANSKGVCNIAVTVRNRSNAATTITVILSAGGSKSVSVAAGKTASMAFAVKVNKKTRCTISATSPAGKSSCATTLEPAFVL